MGWRGGALHASLAPRHPFGAFPPKGPTFGNPVGCESLSPLLPECCSIQDGRSCLCLRRPAEMPPEALSVSAGNRTTSTGTPPPQRATCFLEGAHLPSQVDSLDETNLCRLSCLTCTGKDGPLEGTVLPAFSARLFPRSLQTEHFCSWCM